MTILILGIIVFLGIHTVRIVAPDFRAAQIAARGEGAWKGIYSLISAVGLGLIIWGFALARPEAAFFYEPPAWMKHINLLLMVFAFIFMMVANVPAGKLKPILKHPFLLSIKLWALGHLLSNGDLASLILFGSFLVWAIWDRIAVKRRGDLGTTVAGPVSNDIIAIVSGLVLYVLFVWKLHEWLMGVPVV
ncbi:MAG: NnrU family protein [Rhizobiaceae bacterium]